MPKEKKNIDDLVALAKTYGHHGDSRNEKTLNAWIRKAEYLYESSVKYLGTKNLELIGME